MGRFQGYGAEDCQILAVILLGRHPMKRRRTLLILVCVISVLLAGYAGLWLTAPRHRITLENILAIREGMTEAEVEATLGARAGDYSGLKHEEFLRSLGEHGKIWVGDHASVCVHFDKNGLVIGKNYGIGEYVSFLTKIRRLLGIQ
jgi:hypothetical protein